VSAAPVALRSDASAASSARVAGTPGVTRTSLRDALALGPAAWDAVHAQSVAVSPFGGWAWLSAWADSADPAEVGASEAVLLRGSDGSLQAVLPVVLRRVRFRRTPVQALTWAVGDTGCPDHLDILALPGADLESLALTVEAMPWQLLILGNLAPDAWAARRLAAALAGHGHAVRRHALWGCPYLELCDDWERYLGTLTPTHRQTLRRKERHLRRHYTVTITDYDGARVDEGLSCLMTLHERRWAGGGEAGAFENSDVQRLHRRFAAQLAARQQLWLATLDLDGEPAAAWYGFTDRETVYFYQSGRDPRWERESVGLVLMGAMIRRAIERGFRRFDFLRGDDAYKRHWTETRRMTEEFTIFRPGWRGRWLRALDGAATLRARLYA